MDNKSFLNKLDTIMMLNGEMISGHGEDNFSYCAKEDGAYIAVFDGCGGLGARTYPNMKDYSGAYIASRVASGAFYDWFNEMHAKIWPSNENMVDSIKSYFARAFDVVMPHTEGCIKVKGSMVRDFPTTAAIAYAKNETDGIAIHVIWAGDSRIYAIDSKGLMQLSNDDLDGEDALSNLTSDAALTNLISSDGKYVLHHKRILAKRPIIIIAASDGCFSYYSSPMEFEYMLIEALVNSNSIDGVRKKIINELNEVAGDDFTLGLMAFNFGTYADIKNAMLKRIKLLYDNYISKINENTGADEIKAMWEEYRGDYERCIK